MDELNFILIEYTVNIVAICKPNPLVPPSSQKNATLSVGELVDTWQVVYLLVRILKIDM